MKTKKGITICTLQDLLFPVELRDNPRNTNREYSKVVTGIITGTVPMDESDVVIKPKVILKSDKISHILPTKEKKNMEIDLNYCSPVYELVPNSTIFPKVEEILNKHNIAFTVEYSQIQNTRFYANYTIDDPRFSYKMDGSDDEIKFIWNFQHSYNGLTKYKGIARASLGGWTSSGGRGKRGSCYRRRNRNARQCHDSELLSPLPELSWNEWHRGDRVRRVRRDLRPRRRGSSTESPQPT